MAVRWSESQREQVQVLIDHPVTSSECFALGRSVLPIGREVDPHAHGVVVRPNTRLVRLLRPRHAEAKWWFEHATVVVEQRGVDALAGLDGTPMSEYVSRHFELEDEREVWLDYRNPDLEDPT